MAWVDPATRNTGDLITAAIWNQDVQQNTEWLARDHWRAQMTGPGDQTVASGVAVQVDFNSVVYDFGGLASTANDDFTIPTFPSGITTGLFAFSCNLAWDNNSTGRRRLTLERESPSLLVIARDERSAEVESRTSVYGEVELQANDVLRALVLQDSGAGLDIVQVRISLRWLAWQD